MTPYEPELLQNYLAHLNVIGDEGASPRPRQRCNKHPSCDIRTSWKQRGPSTGSGEIQPNQPHPNLSPVGTRRHRQAPRLNTAKMRLRLKNTSR